jgi:phage terminase large subunit
VVTETKVDISLMKGTQVDFVRCSAKHPAFLGGRGSSKTYSLVAKAFEKAQNNPGIRGCLTQPTFDMIRRNLVPVWEKQWGVVGGKNGIWEFKLWQAGAPGEIAFQNGSLIDLRPADAPEKFRGATYGFFGMDEIAVGNQLHVFLSLMPTLRQEGFDLQGWVTSTPSGHQPWIRQIWMEHINPFTEAELTAENYPIFRAKTVDNWHLPKGELEGWREMFADTRFAAQELEGEFTALEGMAFEEFGDVHIREMPEDTVIVKKVNGLDFGGSSPTSMHELCLDQSDRVWVTKEFYQRNADDYDWIRKCEEWGSYEIRCDPSRSESELEHLRNMYGLRGLKRAAPHAKGFEDRIRLMRNRLKVRSVGLERGKPRIFISPDCPNAISEMRNLAYREPRPGEMVLGKWAPGCNDHAYDDIVYGLSAFDRAGADYSYRPPVSISRDW